MKIVVYIVFEYLTGGRKCYPCVSLKSEYPPLYKTAGLKRLVSLLSWFATPFSDLTGTISIQVTIYVFQNVFPN